MNIAQLLQGEKLSKSVEIIKDFSKIVFPQTIFYLCIFFQQTLNVAFVSTTYKDRLMINAMGISQMYVNCTTYALLNGIISAVETFSSNAYGAKNYNLMGIYFSRARWIGLSYLMLSYVFHFFFCGKILRLFQVDENMLSMSIEYVWLLLLGHMINIPFLVGSRHLVLIEKAYMNLIISLCTITLHPIWCYVLISYFALGINGAGLSVIISQALNSILTVSYLHYSNQLEGSLQYTTKESFKSWKSFLSIAIPGALIICWEWIGYEIQAVFAIFLSSMDYSVHIIAMNLELLLFTPIFGIHIAMAMKTGEKIVSTSVEEVKVMVKVLFFFSFAFIILIQGVIIIFGKYYMYYMSPDEEIYTKSLRVLPIVCLFILSDSGQFFFFGVLKGLGYLVVPTVFSFANSYLIQTTLTYLFAFVFKLGVVGIWLSLCVGTGCVFAAFAYLFFSFDLNAMKQSILDRLETDSKSIEKSTPAPTEMEEYTRI